jgi:7-cyano-7-deazaguanine synthase
MKKTVLVLSGGLDSTCLLYELLKDGDKVECVNFDYGSKHNVREREAADHIAYKTGVQLHYIDLPFIGNLFKSALLFGQNKVPEGHYQEESMKQTVVPFRNAIMLSIAGGYAASIGFDRVSAGIHAGDHAIYPDCRIEFFDVFKDLLRVGLWEHVDFYAPYVWLDKGQIAERGYKLGAPIYETYSCYNGGDIHCGKCGACNERKEALKPLGKDLTKYESDNK